MRHNDMVSKPCFSKARLNIVWHKKHGMRALRMRARSCLSKALTAAAKWTRDVDTLTSLEVWINNKVVRHYTPSTH